MGRDHRGRRVLRHPAQEERAIAARSASSLPWATASSPSAGSRSAIASRCRRAGTNPLYEIELREIVVARPDKDQPLYLLTNDFERPAAEIAALYKERWDIELLFKWIKQNLKIRSFLGRSENAVKIQIYVALIAFMLLRILHNTAARAVKTGTALLLAQLRIGLFAPLHLAQTAKLPPDAANPETAPSTGRFRFPIIQPKSRAAVRLRGNDGSEATKESHMKIGFIGIGNMAARSPGSCSGPGTHYWVHDLRREAADALLAAGAPGRSRRPRWPPDARSSPPACRDRRRWRGLSRPGGLVAHLKPGALYIDHTTNAPALVRRVQALLADQGVAMVDAPVSGGMEGAQTRDLLVMAAASRRRSSAPGRCSRRSPSASSIPAASAPARSPRSCTIRRPLRSTASWPNAGPPGSRPASTPRRSSGVFNEAALGHQMSLKVRLPATYLRGDFEPRFSLALARKDLGLALELARETDTPMRLPLSASRNWSRRWRAAGPSATPRSS